MSLSSRREVRRHTGQQTDQTEREQETGWTEMARSRGLSVLTQRHGLDSTDLPGTCHNASKATDIRQKSGQANLSLLQHPEPKVKETKGSGAPARFPLTFYQGLPPTTPQVGVYVQNLK